MSLQADFCQFKNETLDLTSVALLPKDRHVSVKTPRAEIFAKSITALPKDAQTLSQKCVASYERLEKVHTSLSYALNDLEKISIKKRGEYKIGLEKNGLFKLYKKGAPADSAKLFLKTKFDGLTQLFKQYRESDHVDSISYMGKARSELLMLIEHDKPD